MKSLNNDYTSHKNIITDKIKQSEELIAMAIEKYGEKVEVACSFGKDSIVLLHLALKVKSDIPVFTIMTPYKPKETFEYKDQMIKYYNLNIKEYMSKEQPDPDLPKTNPDKCCQIFKVEPTKEAVKKLDAWICGLRNTEGRTRKDYQFVEEKDGLVKINPILNWTELDVWRYIAINKIPVHPYYAKGFRSLGCEPCTTIVSDEALERDGRWIGTSKCGGECGIHTKSLRL
ncbi:MAG TPA: phosphoadenylyl-sulfate reductase [candidate division Zixibacteria bacterium]|nr:phosphoadenylyl-sulfate reductase [candidate division Zixibacteria bacterium]